MISWSTYLKQLYCDQLTNIKQLYCDLLTYIKQLYDDQLTWSNDVLINLLKATIFWSTYSHKPTILGSTYLKQRYSDQLT